VYLAYIKNLKVGTKGAKGEGEAIYRKKGAEARPNIVVRVTAVRKSSDDP
jgi:hypothetical protein